MKATTIIIAAVLSFQVSGLFAANNETSPTINEVAVFCPTCALAPITPKEAAFEEETEPDAFSFDFLFLAPVTPEEADFYDVVPEMYFDQTILAPVTPEEADFNDTIEDQTFDFRTLAPVTPAEATFE